MTLSVDMNFMNLQEAQFKLESFFNVQLKKKKKFLIHNFSTIPLEKQAKSSISGKMISFWSNLMIYGDWLV